MTTTSSSPRLGLVRSIEAAAASVVIVVAVLGVTLLPLTSAPFVRWLVAAVDAEAYTGIGEEATLEAAEAVRRFVVDENAPALPATLAGREAFDASAVSHLEDVRAVLVPARYAAVASLLLVLAWGLIRWRSPEGRAAIRSAMRASAWTIVVGGVLALLVGLLDFDVLFARFHGLFFKPGTWVFPMDSLLIQVFPLPFWMAAGAIWAVLVLTSAGLLFTTVHRLRFTRAWDGV